jgi:hypothetical protein
MAENQGRHAVEAPRELSMRTVASIGDLVRAVRTLDADDETAAEIARLLGLSIPAAAAGARSAVTVPVSPPLLPLAPGTTAAQAAATNRFARPEPILEPVSNALPARSTEVVALAPESIVQRPPREIPPLETLLPTPAMPQSDGETTLFVRRWQRGVLTALVGVLMPAGGLDIVRIVEQISRRSAIQRLPRRAVYTTRMGLQLLVDGGQGMWPFAADVAELEKLLKLTIAQEAVSVLRFDQTPRNGVGHGSRRTWKAYVPPPAGTPILVISDFGLAGPGADLPSARAEWDAVADAALVARCPLLALTPFPASRWPAWMPAMFSMLHWDRTTTAALAKRAAERATRKYQ